MALTGSTATGVASRAARAARSAARTATRPTSAAILTQLSPAELADPIVMERLARLGILPQMGAQGVTGFVNGGPMAAGFARPAVEQLAIPSVTGGPYNTAIGTPLTSSAAQAASQATAGAAEVPLDLSKYTLDPAALPGTSQYVKPTGIRGLLSWNPSMARAAASQGLEGDALLAASRGGMLAPGSLGRAGAYGVGGVLASNVLRGILGGERDGTWDNAAEDALKYGGIGAGIGSMILPGPGTVIGGIAGGIGGGILGFFTGHDSPTKERDRFLQEQLNYSKPNSLTTLMSSYGISQDTQQQVIAQLQMLAPTLANKEQAQQAVQQVIGQLPTLHEQDQLQLAQQSRVAAMQAYLLPMLQDSQAQTNRYMQQSFSLMNDTANHITDPTIAAIYRQHAADMMTTTGLAQQAYLTQLGTAPALYQQQSQYGLPNPFNPTTTAASTTTGYAP